MAQTEDQAKAAQAVAAEMAARRWNPSDLAHKAKSDPGTIGDFLNGNRWPKLSTQGKIEEALGWPAGSIRSIALGGDVPKAEDSRSIPVGSGVDPELLADLATSTDAEVQRVKDFLRGIKGD